MLLIAAGGQTAQVQQVQHEASITDDLHKTITHIMVTPKSQILQPSRKIRSYKQGKHVERVSGSAGGL